MSHLRDRREFGRRKMKIKNKWEVVLVLVVVAAGIVITTVAAIKAKEKRQSMQAENNVSNNISSKSSVSQVREVAVSHSKDGTNIITAQTNQHKKKTLLALDNSSGRTTKLDQFTPDYDVEYDVVKTVGDEYTAMASESMDRLNRNINRMPHDGLPGFPPPVGINNDLNPNIELSADGAGFVIDQQSLSGLTHIIVKNSDTNNENLAIPSIPSPVEDKLDLKPIINRVKSTNGMKIERKRIPIFAEPESQLDSNAKNGQQKGPESMKEEPKISIPIKIKSRIPIINDMRPNSSPIETSSSIKSGLSSADSVIRFLGLTDEFAHPVEYSSGVMPPIAKVRLPVKRFLPQYNNRKKRQTFLISENQSIIRHKRESEKNSSNLKTELKTKLVDHILEMLKTNFHQKSDKSNTFPKLLKQNKNEENELITEESRYMPFNERSFISEEREDIDNDDSEGTNNENVSPLFNFDDIESRFPSVISSSRQHKHNDKNYSPDESRKQQKYGILGSGNFEIIRGGIYSDDESASNNVPNYVHENENDSTQENNSKSEPINHFTPNSESNEDDSEPNQFGPFNVDFFSGSPVLGFQGYDNFGATSIDKYQTPSPVRSSIKLRGQRRQFFDSHSAPSNLFVITADKDLDSDS